MTATRFSFISATVLLCSMALGVVFPDSAHLARAATPTPSPTPTPKPPLLNDLAIQIVGFAWNFRVVKNKPGERPIDVGRISPAAYARHQGLRSAMSSLESVRAGDPTLSIIAVDPTGTRRLSTAELNDALLKSTGAAQPAYSSARFTEAVRRYQVAHPVNSPATMIIVSPTPAPLPTQ